MPVPKFDVGTFGRTQPEPRDFASKFQDLASGSSSLLSGISQLKETQDKMNIYNEVATTLSAQYGGDPNYWKAQLLGNKVDPTNLTKTSISSNLRNIYGLPTNQTGGGLPGIFPEQTFPSSVPNAQFQPMQQPVPVSPPQSFFPLGNNVQPQPIQQNIEPQVKGFPQQKSIIPSQQESKPIIPPLITPSFQEPASERGLPLLDANSQIKSLAPETRWEIAAFGKDENLKKTALYITDQLGEQTQFQTWKDKKQRESLDIYSDNLKNYSTQLDNALKIAKDPL